MSFLVSIPADPTRNHGLVLRWPGHGYYSTQAGTWKPAYDSSCLTPFGPDPDDPTCLVATVPDPHAPEPVLLKLVALDADGSIIRTMGVETIEPPASPQVGGVSRLLLGGLGT
jgi:hypothetical protein